MVSFFSSRSEQLKIINDLLSWLDDDEGMVIILDDKDKETPMETDGDLWDKLQDGISSGRVLLLLPKSFYFKNGELNPVKIFESWLDVMERMREEGFEQIMAVGDLSWSAGNPPFFEAVLRYEAQSIINGLPRGMTALCFYDKRIFSGEQISRVRKIHELQLEAGRLSRNFWLLNRFIR